MTCTPQPIAYETRRCVTCPVTISSRDLRSRPKQSAILPPTSHAPSRDSCLPFQQYNIVTCTAAGRAGRHRCRSALLLRMGQLSGRRRVDHTNGSRPTEVRGLHRWRVGFTKRMDQVPLYCMLRCQEFWPHMPSYAPRRHAPPQLGHALSTGVLTLPMLRAADHPCTRL